MAGAVFSRVNGYGAVDAGVAFLFAEVIARGSRRGADTGVAVDDGSVCG